MAVPDRTSIKDSRMLRPSIAMAIAMLSIPCFAQQQSHPNPAQCEQVRSAVAQYGLQAARKNAHEQYGLTLSDVHKVELECGIKDTIQRGRR